MSYIAVINIWLLAFAALISAKSKQRKTAFEYVTLLIILIGAASSAMWASFNVWGL